MKSTWPKAAEVIARGGTTAEAARAASVTTRTIRTWKADEPMFVDAIDDTRGRMLEETAGILAHVSTAAARKLGELVEEGSDTHSLAAARAALDLATRYRIDTGLEQRLRTLEIATRLREEF